MKLGLPDNVQLERLVEQLSATVDKSIPQACGSVH